MARRILLGAIAILVVWRIVPAPAWFLISSTPPSAPDTLLALASHEWERLPVLAEAAMRYPNAVVLLTVPQAPNEHNCFRCSARVSWLERLGVDRTRVIEVVISEGGTWGEAVTIRQVSRHARFGSLLVVTSPYHSRRSLATFRHHFAGTDVDIGVYPALSASPATPDRWLLHHYDREYVAYEWAALVYYAARMAVDVVRGHSGNGLRLQ